MKFGSLVSSWDRFNPGVRRWKPSGDIEEAGQGKQFSSRYTTIEAGAALKTNGPERGRSRRRCLITSLLTDITDVVLCFDVHLLIDVF
jgi:hypothetical protein